MTTKFHVKYYYKNTFFIPLPAPFMRTGIKSLINCQSGFKKGKTRENKA